MGIFSGGWAVKTIAIGSLLMMGFVLVMGCDKNPTANTAEKPATVAKVDEKEKAEPAGVGHDWWCDEHGVKEVECSMCSSKVAKACKRDGNWCELHQRAQNQCFICDPKLEAKFAAEYVAKFNKQPPEPTGQKPEKK